MARPAMNMRLVILMRGKMAGMISRLMGTMLEDHYYAIELLAHAREEVEVALKVGGERY